MKTALVTGSGRGIGRAAALRLARDGWRLALHCHQSRKQAQALCEELVGMGCDAAVFEADISSREQVFSMRDKIAAFGQPSLIVCNAGIAHQGLFTDVSESQWLRLVNVNLSGVFYCCQAFAPAMIRQKSGSIITVSSIWGLCGASCEAAYSAAKAGVIGLTRALAQELGPSGITVNCVAPGVIDTDMCAHLDAAARSDLRSQIPLGRLGTPEDVAGVIAFLASPEASYLTGQVISPGGGIVL